MDALSGPEVAPAVRSVPFVYLLFALGGAAIAAATVITGAAFDPWLLALAAVVLAAFVLPVPSWLSRWAPLLLIGALFLALGGLSARQAVHAVTTLPIDVDRSISGVVVPVWLQQHLAPLLDASVGALTLEYMLHYVAPLATAWWLWRRHRDRFDRFVAAYILAMVLGFALYLVFPQTPPWFAAQQGILPPLHRSIVETLQWLHAGTLYAGADPEPFGAMPSLHVTVPVVVALTLIAASKRRWRWLWLLYPATVAFGVVFMAEHYLLDTIAGAALGVVAVYAVRLLPPHVIGARMPTGALDILRRP